MAPGPPPDPAVEPAPDPAPEPAPDPAAASAAAPELSRSPARLRAELADLRRYLAETPPHHGAGARQALEARVARLERALVEGGG